MTGGQRAGPDYQREKDAVALRAPARLQAPHPAPGRGPCRTVIDIRDTTHLLAQRARLAGSLRKGWVILMSEESFTNTHPSNSARVPASFYMAGDMGPNPAQVFRPLSRRARHVVELAAAHSSVALFRAAGDAGSLKSAKNRA